MPQSTTVPWTPDAIGDQTGRTVLVTGANSGLGFHVATEFARRGADVLLACRNPERGRAALAQLNAAVADSGREASAELVGLDVADLASVRRAAADVLQRRSSVDVLVNNAGVMVPPFGRTADGFETQVGTNHLGHFAFTGLLLPALLAGDGARVVSVASVAHKFGRLDRDNYQSERSYQKWLAYGQSKLSNLLFAFELQRRADAAGAPIVSTAAHPGLSDTNLWKMTPLGGNRFGEALAGVLGRAVGQPAAQGAWPLLRAASDPDVAGGEYFGPGGRQEWRGFPVQVPAHPSAYDTADAAWLWARSVEWTGVDFGGLTA
ncbi:oxidoreductase [Kineococcus rhizosphaerae]|uniref:Protochlorophyllide reductase n=1 Tax=Kineococcus rhizosphaerae TaxID=559628 RepID=A0A2T0R533_9ACTN|nr:oxidoreductase [Kineococcus rhizosphaerae]PRY15825.1 protochlorophyllide reductase [Kineococcus rhizosphaerae]